MIWYWLYCRAQCDWCRAVYIMITEHPLSTIKYTAVYTLIQKYHNNLNTHRSWYGPEVGWNTTEYWSLRLFCSEFFPDLVNILQDFYQRFYHLFTTGFYGGSQIKALINDNFLIKTVQALKFQNFLSKYFPRDGSLMVLSLLCKS